MMKRPDTGQNIALSVTIVVALLLLILLMGTHLDLPVRQSDKESEYITMIPDDSEVVEELFIEPVLQDAGEPDQKSDVSSEPVPVGEPDQAQVPNDKLVVNGKSETPNPSAEKVVAQPRPETVKTTEPSKKDKPDSRISSTMKGQFSPHNGRPDGNAATSASASGGKGTGVSGTMGNGRKLERWILPEVRLRQKTVVKVTVMVRADGSVESATCQPGSADASLMEACRKASLKTRWTPKTGASLARGVITWTLVPRQ